jgi:uncharacterized lipoprotein YddW (UPF0748 family)
VISPRAIWTAAFAALLGCLVLLASVPPAAAQLFSGSSPFAPVTPGDPTAPAPVSPIPPNSSPLAPAPGSLSATSGDASQQFRGLWVDAYRDGFKTRAQVDQLVADARRANINALIVQVRRRGDSFYARSLEPRTEDPDLAPGFDPLAYLIERARAEEPHIEVHAWFIVTTIWGSQTRAPVDRRHVFNQHGPDAVGREDWLSRREDGETWSRGYFIDPGHPDAARYTTDVALNIVREYEIDGLHLDYIRYPERADGMSWGYNQVSIDRFNARYGRTGRPPGNDPAWNQWRRDQVTALVRGIYLGALAIKPGVKLSAAVIPWGDGPRTEADWLKTAGYSSVFQDWRAWLEEGILDQVMPMNYFRESAGQGRYFDNWLAWQRDHAYGRQVIPAVALYLNEPAASISQVKRALAPNPDGPGTAGVALYSYAATHPTSAGDDTVTTRGQAAEIWAALTESGPGNGGQPPFAARAAPPPTAWKASPSVGNVLLRVPGLDGARVDFDGPKAFGGETDGTGTFGALAVPPGRYLVSVRPNGGRGALREGELEVRTGALSQLELP